MSALNAGGKAKTTEFRVNGRSASSDAPTETPLGATRRLSLPPLAQEQGIAARSPSYAPGPGARTCAPPLARKPPTAVDTLPPRGSLRPVDQSSIVSHASVTRLALPVELTT